MRARLSAQPASPEETRPEAPRWDLSDLFAGPDDPRAQALLDEAAAEAAHLEETFKGRLAAISGEELAQLIAAYERLEEKLGRVNSYASLLFAAHRDDVEIGRFYQNVEERVNAIETRLLFVTLELNKLEDAELEAKIAASPALARYRPWIRNVRAFRPHQLSDEIERVLHEKHVTGRAAWIRLFDETMAGLRFPLDGRELTAQQAFDLLSAKDRSQREAAATSIGKVLAANIKLFARITNTLAKDKQIEDGWRKFPRPISARNLANQVEDEVVDALIAAVRDAYPRISHRYYALKARWLGLDKLQYWDRNAPLPEDDDRRRPWGEAKVVVLDAYRRFSPRLASILDRFFEQHWIDAEVRPGKDSGAFCHPTVPSVHPFVLMNYQGKTRDIMTLAHELGHGVHQTLAAEQGYLMSGTPLTLAETASVFGEQLTFEALLDQERDPARRRVLLAAKIEDKINTVVRQIAFCEFERRVHDRRKEGELTPDDIGALWMEVQSESLGPAFEFREDYRTYWSYIPHFVHVPFYVYAYAFGDCLVSSLYAVYEQQPEGFEERYLGLLRAGGTLRHKELLAPFGLDASDPAFWAKGLGLLERLIDRLEAELPAAG
ncbi:MAG: M3 family oligoendopeptidase [Geminicoccaceae bacterium]|nr:M3 family oligoendopeptidase [Geminicoccaceae bacterium]MCX8100516.1 M3 family oligoendopeptidase [Geminicoccaceae bacterium]MDW8370275.1 M3 family oligoendopeptidase [Geminicoccaceae bacterium]